MDKFSAMERFVRVAELGNFSRAAEALGLPKASVSTAVTHLENELGTRLLERSTRRVSLTPDGREYLQQCQRLLAEIDELHGRFQRDPSQLSGSVRVDMPARMASTLVLPKLPEFLEQHPGIHVAIGSADRQVDLVSEGFDCVVRVGDLRDSSLVARKICDAPTVNCASPAYLQRYGLPTELEDLDRHCLIGYSTQLSAGFEGFEYEHNNQVRHRPMRTAVTVNGTESYLAACLAGLGIIQVPVLSLQNMIDAGQLQVVLREFQAPPMPVNVVYPSRKNTAQRVQVFMQWLTGLLNKEAQAALAAHARQ